MGSMVIHFRTVGIFVAQNVSCEFYDHHLHAQTDAERRYVIRAGIFRRDDFSFNTPLSESWTNDNACHRTKLVSNIFLIDKLAIDEIDGHLHIVVDAGKCEALAYALICVL